LYWLLLLNKEYREGWKSLKKISKPSFSNPRTSTIKSKEGYDIVSPKKQLARWAENYKDFASDQSGHSLDQHYWSRVLRSYTLNPIAWNINDPISVTEIKKRYSIYEKQ